MGSEGDSEVGWGGRGRDREGRNILDQVSHVHGHLLNSGVVEGLNVTQRTLVLLRHHVDGHTLPAKPTSSTNPEGEGRS